MSPRLKSLARIGGLIAVCLLAFSLIISGLWFGFNAHPDISKASDSNHYAQADQYRIYLDYSMDNIAQIPRHSTFYAYAKVGEIINLGSSAIGIGNGDILIQAPDKSTSTCLDQKNHSGFIQNRTEEKAGPNPDKGGFSPCQVEIAQPSQVGVWKFTFISPKQDGQAGLQVYKADDEWTQQNDISSIVAWYIAVHKADKTRIDGRVYAQYLSLHEPNFDVPLNTQVFVLTKEGYQYRVDTHGMRPAGFIFFSNNKGFQDKNANPLYKSLSLVGENLNNRLPDDVSMHSPDKPDTDDEFTHKIFTERPDPNMPATAPSADGIQWLYTPPAETVQPSDFHYEADSKQSDQSDNRGHFVYSSSYNSNYTITIDTNQNGKFGDANDRILNGNGNQGLNTINWDGKDQNGSLVSSDQPFQAQLKTYQGEVHFPFLDVENNEQGFILERIAPSGGETQKVYYDDSEITADGAPNPVKALDGIGSSSGAHTYSNWFGDIKAIDTWSYISSNPMTTNFVSKVVDLQTKITHDPTDFTTGELGSFKITYDNLSAIPVSKATINTVLDDKFENVSWNCELTQGEGMCAKQNGNDMHIDQTLDLDAHSQITVSFHGVIKKDAHDAENITSKISPPSDTIDSNTDNNQATDSVQLKAPTPINHAPLAQDDVSSTDKNKPIVINILHNDSDPDDNLKPETLTLKDNPTHGQTKLTGDNQIEYTPNNDYHGQDSFAYQVCDTENLCDEAHVHVDVNEVIPPNHPPVANPDQFGTAQETHVTITRSQILANDSDPDDNLKPDSFEVTSQPTSGKLSPGSKSDELIYTPQNGFHGQDKFSYEICDVLQLCTQNIVNVTVTPVDHPPVANDDSITIHEDTQTQINVLQNDTDPDDNLDPTKLSVKQQPKHGDIVLNNSQISYKPNLNYNGPDKLTYRICDTTNLCSEANLTITVNPIDDAPAAQDDSTVTKKNNSVTVNVLNNDIDPDSPTTTLTIQIAEQPTHGKAIIQNNELVYTPLLNYVGPDATSYKLCDQDNLCAQAQVTIDVQDIPAPTPTPVIISLPPIANPDALTLDKNSTLNTINVLANDVDPADSLDLSTLAQLDKPTHGTAQIVNGQFNYIPAYDYSGLDSFTYKICNKQSKCAQSIVSLTINDIPTPPRAVEDTISTVINTPVMVKILQNDVGDNIDKGQVSITKEPEHGVVNLQNNTALYSPQSTFSGPDTFDYQVCTAPNLCSTTNVNVDVKLMTSPTLARTGGPNYTTLGLGAVAVASVAYITWTQRRKLKIK